MVGGIILLMLTTGTWYVSEWLMQKPSVLTKTKGVETLSGDRKNQFLDEIIRSNNLKTSTVDGGVVGLNALPAFQNNNVLFSVDASSGKLSSFIGQPVASGVSFVSTPQDAGTTTNKFLADNNVLFGLTPATLATLQSSVRNEVKSGGSSTFYSRDDQKFNETIPVVGGFSESFMNDKGDIISVDVSHVYEIPINFDTAPFITSDQAQQTALSYLGWAPTSVVISPAAELAILPYMVNDTLEFVLIWKI